MTARTSATLLGRFRQPGGYQPFVLHAVEGGIDGAARGFLGARQFLDLGVNCHAIGVGVQRQDGGEDNLLELAQRLHFIYIVEIIKRASSIDRLKLYLQCGTYEMAGSWRNNRRNNRRNN